MWTIIDFVRRQRFDERPYTIEHGAVFSENVIKVRYVRAERTIPGAITWDEEPCGDQARTLP